MAPERVSEDGAAAATEHEPRYAEGARLPDFVIIGAAKTGTTTLYDRLGRHPAVHMSRDKEPTFFSADKRFAWGLEWYGRQFEGAPPAQLCGEASTRYTWYPKFPAAAERMAHIAPHVKLIYMMRHPVERAYSHYLQRITKERWSERVTRIERTFEEHVERDPVCLDASDYMTQIEQYLRHFERRRLLLLVQDDLRDDAAGLMRRVCAFLGIEPAAEPERAGGAGEKGDRNVTGRYLEQRARLGMMEPLKRLPGMRRLASLAPRRLREGVYEALKRTPWGRRQRRLWTPEPMRPETRAALLERYRPQVEAVAELMGRELSGWMR